MSELVTIESLAAGGDGVAHTSDGRVVFVARTAIGDQVEIDLVEEKKSFARGVVRNLRESGPGRIEAQCSLFAAGRCGGCQWLHLASDAQAEAKMALVAAALRHVIASEAIAPLRSPAPATRWRRRARFHWVRPKGSSSAVVGFTAPRSKRVSPATDCIQIDSALADVLGEIDRHLAPHLHKRGEIEVVLATDNQALVAVSGPHTRRGLEALAAQPTVAGVRGRGAPLGSETVEVEAGLSASASSFTQASTAGNRALLECVDDALALLARGQQLGNVLELFAGGGNITRVLAKHATRVVAVERSSGACIERENVEWLFAPSEAALARLKNDGESFDVVVLDPPRTGAAACIKGIVELSARGVVYVSCDPATLARDLSALIEGGYRIETVSPLDLMPQTSHVEVVAVLTRRESPT